MDSASPAERQLEESVLAGSFPDELAEHLIGDKAHDSGELDKQLQEEKGIEMIAPNRRKRSKTQDGMSRRPNFVQWNHRNSTFS